MTFTKDNSKERRYVMKEKIIELLEHIEDEKILEIIYELLIRL